MGLSLLGLLAWMGLSWMTFGWTTSVLMPLWLAWICSADPSSLLAWVCSFYLGPNISLGPGHRCLPLHPGIWSWMTFGWMTSFFMPFWLAWMGSFSLSLSAWMGSSSLSSSLAWICSSYLGPNISFGPGRIGSCPDTGWVASSGSTFELTGRIASSVDLCWMDVGWMTSWPVLNNRVKRRLCQLVWKSNSAFKLKNHLKNYLQITGFLMYH